MVELKAWVWNEHQEPEEVHVEVEVPTETESDYLQRGLMQLLETYEYGKLTRGSRVTTKTGTVPGEFTLYYRAFTDEFRGRQIVSGMSLADLDRSFQELKKQCSLRVFSPDELYALKPISVDYDPYHVLNLHLTEEIPYHYEIDGDKVVETRRLETRTLVFHDYDGRRTWELSTVWFDGKPVMVTNSSGRDGDEYCDRFVTDAGAFGDLVRFLQSFLLEEEKQGFVEASAKIPAMTEFYGATIHDYYDVDKQEPKKL